MRTIIRVLGPSNQGMLNFYPLWAETIFSIVFLFVIWGMIILTSLISDVISISPVSIFVPHLQQKLCITGLYYSNHLIFPQIFGVFTKRVRPL